jgi:hypothetical protein
MAGVTSPVSPAVVHGVPTGAVYSILLLFHVGCAVVGFGAVAMTGVQARRARRGPEAKGAEGVRRYFRPGINVAARALYGVPVFGFGLIAASKGAFDSGDGFVVAGLGLWAVATVVAEVVMWPGERRIQEAVTGGWERARGFDRQCLSVSVSAVALSVVFVAAVVLMVARP